MNFILDLERFCKNLSHDIEKSTRRSKLHVGYTSKRGKDYSFICIGKHLAMINPRKEFGQESSSFRRSCQL